jgi:hypothetical protein
VKLTDIERRRNITLELYVMGGLARGRSQAQIAASLGIAINTLRRHLRKRGYRIVCEYRLVPTDASRPGQSPERPDAGVAGAD